MNVQLVWVQALAQWHMLDERGFFLMYFPDCLNFNRLFPGLSKEEPNKRWLGSEKSWK